MQRVRSFFCSAAEPLNLAVFRLVLFAWLLRLIARTDYTRFVQMPAGLRVPPPGYESFFHWIPLQVSWVAAAQTLALISCAAAMVGVMTRASAAVACVCATYLLGLPEIFGKIDHLGHHLIWFSAILAAAPSGDALSIDALRAAWRRADRGDTAPPPPSVAYALPLRFVWLLIGVIYLFPGVWKLHAGTDWFASDNIKYLMYQFWSEKGFLPAFRIDRYPLLYRASGLGTIVFETSFVFCLFFPRLRLLALTGGVFFHWMTKIYLGIFFHSLLLCYAAFVDWSWLCGYLGSVLYRQELVLRYDARDARSRRLVASLRVLDVFRRVDYVGSADARLDLPGAAGNVSLAIGTRTLTGPRAALAVAAYVPLIVPVYPLLLASSARRGRSPVGAAVPAAAQPRTAAIIIVGSLLLVANIYCGFTRTTSWPFSVYPQFTSIIRSPVRTSLEAIVRGLHGEARPVDIGLRPAALERFRQEQPAARNARLEAMKRLLTANDLTLRPGEALQFYEVTRSILPEEHDRAPLRRELLWEFRPEQETATPQSGE